LPVGVPIHHYDSARQLSKATVLDNNGNHNLVYSVDGISPDAREKAVKEFISAHKADSGFVKTVAGTSLFPRWEDIGLPQSTAPPQPAEMMKGSSQQAGGSGSVFLFCVGCVVAVAGVAGIGLAWRSRA